MSKQDRQGARTVTDLERKYNLGNFGERFAEVYGIATDARKATIELEENLKNEITKVRTEIRESTEGILLKSEFEAYQGTLSSKLDSEITKVRNEIRESTEGILLRSEFESEIASVRTEIRESTEGILLKSEFEAYQGTLSSKLDSEITKVRNEIRESTEGILLRSEFEVYQGTISSELDAYRGTIAAELALKVSKDDTGQIVSMINASADLIALNSNRLIIDSDFFELTETGVATITSAQIDYAKIDYARMTDAHIGSAYFSDNETYASPQISFLRDGIYLFGERANVQGNRYCIVWENTDGTDMYRLRGGIDKSLHLEGVEYENHELDLVVFGISIRELYNKVNGLAGHEHVYTNSSRYESCTAWGQVTHICDCGYSYSEEIPPTGHSYSNGVCTRCGATDPNYSSNPCANGHVGVDSVGEDRPYDNRCILVTRTCCSVCGGVLDVHEEVSHIGQDDGYGHCTECGWSLHD